MTAAARPDTRYGCPECKAVFRSGFARCPLDGTPLQELVDDPLVGSMFADRYIIEACIGEGGMGRVYRARHQRVSRRFAIKVLYGDHAADPKMRDRFAREAEAASRLDHANVISVVDFGETRAGLLYLVMDYVDGRELAVAIKQEGALAAPRVERILRHLCRGLVHAHDKGLVHRDFKGENVILTGDGEDEVARIVDFGIAFMLEAVDVQRLTTEGMVLGTPAYMSPEQATGAELDLRTDLFSLGVLTYEMLAGVLPFEGPPLAIARQNLVAEPPPAAERVPGLRVSARLEAIAMRLMAKDPDDRYQSAQEVISALDAGTADPLPIVAGSTPARAVVAGSAVRGASGESVPVASQTDGALASTEAVSIQRRNRARWLGGTAAVALAAVALAAVYLLRGGAERSPSTSTTRPVTEAARGGSGGDSAQGVSSTAEPLAPRPVEPPSTDALAASPVDPVGHPDRPVVARHPDRPAVAAPMEIARPTAVEPPAAAATTAAAAGSSAPVDPDPDPAPITTASLQRRYVAVGEAIERLARARGDQVTAPFRRDYLEIPFSDALRTPSLRREVDVTLRRLATEVNRQIEK